MELSKKCGDKAKKIWLLDLRDMEKTLTRHPFYFEKYFSPARDFIIPANLFFKEIYETENRKLIFEHN